MNDQENTAPSAISPSPKILAAFEDLKYIDSRYKRESVEVALTHQAEITPMLIHFLEREVLAEPLEFAARGNMCGPLYALFLLTHFKETSAHRAMVQLFSLSEESVETLFGDFTTECLPIALYRTCGGCYDDIRALVHNRQASVYSRNSTVRAITFAVVDGNLSRDSALSELEGLFTEDAEPDDPLFLGLVAISMCDLYPDRSLPILEEACRTGLIDREYLDMDDVARIIAKGEESVLTKLREAKLIDDSFDENLHDYLERWQCFTAKNENEEASDLRKDLGSFFSASDVSLDEYYSESNPKKKKHAKNKRKAQKKARRKSRNTSS